MNNYLFDMIFKRKSFHLFRNTGALQITETELNEIENEFYKITPLITDIKVKIEIVKDSKICKRGQEYCILFYSEKKDGYLQNIGYIGEQLDLYLVSKNIGTLWYGIGKPEVLQKDGLDYVIMIAISKVDSENKFRKDMFKSKRKHLAENWEGNYSDIGNIVRFAPSACNTQPWFVKASENEIAVYRYKKEGKRGIMPKEKVDYYNRIDMGIFLCFLELCLNKSNIGFSKEIYTENASDNNKILNAIYKVGGRE